MSLYALRSKTRPPLELPRLDGFDQCGGNGVVQARIIVVCELMRGGAYLQAGGICSGWCGELDGWGLLQRNGHLVVGCPPIVNYLHLPQFDFGVPPPLEDDGPIKGDSAPGAMKENLTARIHQCSNG